MQYVKKKDRIQETIHCACGCGQTLEKYDKYGQKRKYINGHNMIKHVNRIKKPQEMIECACGCGQLIKKYTWTRERKYVRGHNRRGVKQPTGFRIERKEVFCACGCGQKLITPNKWGYHSKYIQGHNRRGKCHPNSIWKNQIIAEKVIYNNKHLVIDPKKIQEVFNIAAL